MTTIEQGNTAASRCFGDSCGETISIEASSTISPSLPTDVLPASHVTASLVEWTPLPMQSSSLWHMTEYALTEKPSGSILEDYGLIPLRNMFASSWTDQHKVVLKQVLEKVIVTIDVVWDVFRKVYHYPLDPP